jgi:hypothetical protein
MPPRATGPPIDETTKKCPMCAELIQLEAIVCRYCGHRFDPDVVGREIRKVEAEQANLPGGASRWCLVVDQVPPDRRTTLLAVLRELEPAEGREVTGSILDGRDVRIAAGLSLGRANALLARLLAADVPARKELEPGAPPTPPQAPTRRPPRAHRGRRRARRAVGNVALTAALGILVLAALVLGYLDLERYRSRQTISARAPASPASHRTPEGVGAAPPADSSMSSPEPAAARDDPEGFQHVFFFSRGDRLATMAGEPIGTVDRLEPAHAFPNGKVGAAYIVRTPAQTLAVFRAAPLERMAHLQ